MVQGHKHLISKKADDNRASIKAPLFDLRFRSLLGAQAWSELPKAVRDRFSKRLANGKAVSYAGQITECRTLPAGVWHSYAGSSVHRYRWAVILIFPPL